MMMHEGCSVGGELITRTIPRYRVKTLGIEGVELFDAVEQTRCTKCRAVIETTIPSMPELIAAAAVARAGDPTKLDSEEIRFLRRALGWQSKTMAKQIGVAAETVSRWEREENPEPINLNNEKLLRLFVVQHLGPVAPAIDVTEDQVLSMNISSVRRPTDKVRLAFWRLVFKQERKGKAVKAWDIKDDDRKVATG